jgi:DNA-binding transcriptional LysR family regulator
MELRHLRYFVTVAEELHFGPRRAQAALVATASVDADQRLETEIGTLLLARTRRRVELTTAGGRFFCGRPREILSRVEQATAAARRAGRGEIGELAVGFVTIADYKRAAECAVRVSRAASRRPAELARSDH